MIFAGPIYDILYTGQSVIFLCYDTLTGYPERSLVSMNDQHGEERRKSQRFPFREDILIDGAKLCTSNEISEGGLFVSAIQIFEEGEVIDVTIPLGGEQITVKGQVKYCQPGIGMGVMFHNLNDEQKTKIKNLVDRVSGRSS